MQKSLVAPTNLFLSALPKASMQLNRSPKFSALPVVNPPLVAKLTAPFSFAMLLNHISAYHGRELASKLLSEFPLIH